MLRYITLLSLTIALVAMAVLFTGCGDSSNPEVVAPVLVVQTSASADGPWTDVPNMNGFATVPVGNWERVHSDSGVTIEASVHAPQDEDQYAPDTAVRYGGWRFDFVVEKEGRTFNISVTVDEAVTTPTQLTDFRVSVIASPGYTPIAPDGFGIARVPEGQEIYFWVGGYAYPLGTGTRGGEGGIDGSTITGSFWTIEGEGGEYLPVTIPFTQGETYRLYHPLNGEYIVTAAFSCEGQAVTTTPLHFTVGLWSPPQ